MKAQNHRPLRQIGSRRSTDRTPARSGPRVRGRAPAWGAAALLLLGSALALGGCAKSPTRVLVTLSGDGTVPPFAILRGSVARDANAVGHTTVAVVAPVFGDSDADRPAPFSLPLDFLVPIPTGWSGSVNITVDGLDWDTNKVLATGTTVATATSEQTTRASLTLKGVPGGSSGDGGSDGAADGAANDEADGGASDAEPTAVDATVD